MMSRNEREGGGGVGGVGVWVAGELCVAGWLLCCIVFGELGGFVVVCWETQ
jgi:hypothetical protein